MVFLCTGPGVAGGECKRSARSRETLTGGCHCGYCGYCSSVRAADGGTVIHKGYANVPWGQVHYRAAGSGPPVILLHDSPRSSVLHEPLVEALADRWTAIALDTPGYGGSDPLATAAPDIGDFADALAVTLDALAVPACPVYGCHTSSKIALEVAVRHPGRASLIVMDGLSVPVEPVPDAFIERYMAPFRITDDGAYLATTWARTRDLHRFFPWFSHTAEHRLAMELPPPEALHRYALDLLMAGTHYADAYAAAMRYDPVPALDRLQDPAVVTCRRDDVLYSHLERLPETLPDGVRREPLPADRNVWRARLRELFANHGDYVAGVRLPGPGEVFGRPGPAWSYWHARQGEQLRLRFRGELSSRHAPVLLLPELPGSAASAAPLADALAADRRTLTLDPPGCGESTAAADPGPERFAADLLRLLEDLDWPSVDVAATFTAAPVALELARVGAGRVGRVVFEGVPLVGREEREELAADYCVPLAPRRDGGHLLAAWTMLRDRELNWPWTSPPPCRGWHSPPCSSPIRTTSATGARAKPRNAARGRCWPRPGPGCTREPASSAPSSTDRRPVQGWLESLKYRLNQAKE